MDLRENPYGDNRDERLKIYCNEVVYRMFVATADGNYILARSAFFLGLAFDFYWLSVHALEKYYKAILLMNGHSAKTYKHDIVKLHKKIRELEPRLEIENLVAPDIENLRWSEEPFDSFLARFNRFGSPNNRYALYGHYILEDDVLKIDQHIWAVRRFCRALCTNLVLPDGRIITRDYVQEILNMKTAWHLNRGPLEDLINSPTEDSRRADFLKLNSAFSPIEDHRSTYGFSKSQEPPLADWFRLIRADTQDTSRETSAFQVLDWVRNNIYLMRSDSLKIDQALSDYKAARIAIS